MSMSLVNIDLQELKLQPHGCCSSMLGHVSVDRAVLMPVLTLQLQSCKQSHDPNVPKPPQPCFAYL